MLVAKNILGRSIDFAKPLSFNIKAKAVNGYIRTQQWRSDVAWAAFMSMAIKMIPDDLYDYDWLDFELEIDLEEYKSDNYSI